MQIKNVFSHFILFTILSFIPSSEESIYRTKTTKQALFMKVYQDRYLQDSQLVQHDVKNFGNCAHLCLNYTLCKSINFCDTVVPMVCQLVAKDRNEVVVTDFVEKKGWKYYDTGIRNCKSALEFNNVQSGFFVINPDSYRSGFKAYCYMLNGVYMTEVGHNWVRRTYVSGLENCPSLMPLIQYDTVTNIKALIAMVDQSDSCKQHVKVECLNSQVYLKYGRTLSCMGATDRNDKPIGYWGGGNAGKYCACAVNGLCSPSTMECNCESFNGGLYTDEGNYTDKSILPIRRVISGDTGGSNEYQYFTIGFLICSMA